MSFSATTGRPSLCGELLGDDHALEPGDVLGQLHEPRHGRDHARHPDDDSVEAIRGNATRVHQPACQPDEDVEHDADVGAGMLDVLPRDDDAVEVAQGRPQEARSDVDAEHERGLGDRLEEQRPVARSARIM